MDVKVVDASALAALLFEEPEAEAIALQLENCRLGAPTLLGYELANICVVESRWNPDLAAALTAAFGLRDRLGVSEHATDHGEILDLAIATGLTGHDASYLWLARHLDAELVTLDQRLGEAFRAIRG